MFVPSLLKKKKKEKKQLQEKIAYEKATNKF